DYYCQVYDSSANMFF
nr:immunoglobulin light chain junction region [Macaca mulatta]